MMSIMALDLGTGYTKGMSSCEPGCTCKLHKKARKKCQPGCACGRHVIGDERRRRIGEALAGRSLSPEHRAALKCPEGCTCAKHGLRNSGQFQQGAPGAFAGHIHNEETRAKLASYTGESASSYTHGMSKTPTYVSWGAMRSRCRDESNGSWEQYGGRGITVCDRWAASFENFLEDMGERPSLDHQIDRIDPDGNYEPGNCQWLTRAENNARRKDPGGWVARRRRMQP